MIVLADENVHTLISDRLAADGHEVAHIFDLARGITDEEVLALAVGREALLITNDLDSASSSTVVALATPASC